MPLGFSSISEYAISEIPSTLSPDAGGGDLEVAYALLWDLAIAEALAWDLDVTYDLAWDLTIQAYLGEELIVPTTPIDIGDTVTLRSAGVLGGDVILSADIILQIKTPDGVQWPDIPGSALTYDPSTQRYSYRYYIRGAYAQSGVHNFRFRVRTTDSEGDVDAAKWSPFSVRYMPFSET